MLTVCYTAKGGQGCTTIAATLALLSEPATVVDLTGDIPAVLGLPEPEGPGVTDLAAGNQPLTLANLDRCAIPAATGLRVIPRGHGQIDDTSDRWEDLASLLADAGHPFFVDAGTGSPITGHARRRLLVTRHCYLALRRATHSALRPHGIITIREDGRSLDVTDIEKVVGVPVLATVDVTANVARAIDAGILAGRVPTSLDQALRATLEIATPPG